MTVRGRGLSDMAIAGALLAVVVVVIAAGMTASSAKRAPANAGTDPCDSQEATRRAWIDAKSPEMGGYSPATFRWRATGACADTLRVYEGDCGVPYLRTSLGAKPFMRRAVAIGFRLVSCGSDEYDIAAITDQ